jgi:DNA polymerase III delta subunit
VAKVLALNAVLSEQFRSIWTFQQAQKQGLSETELLSKTGWKAGKLYPLKRAAAKFSELEVEDILNKLELLDIEQKSTTLPSRVVLELVVSQLIS